MNDIQLVIKWLPKFTSGQNGELIRFQRTICNKWKKNKLLRPHASRLMYTLTYKKWSHLIRNTTCAEIIRPQDVNFRPTYAMIPLATQLQEIPQH